MPWCLVGSSNVEALAGGVKILNLTRGLSAGEISAVKCSHELSIRRCVDIRQLCLAFISYATAIRSIIDEKEIFTIDIVINKSCCFAIGLLMKGWVETRSIIPKTQIYINLKFLTEDLPY